MEAGELGAKLKEARVRAGVTLQEVADRAGLSKSFISQIEWGTAQPSIGSLKRISNALDIPVWQLLDEEPPQRLPSPRAEPEPDVDALPFQADKVEVVRHDWRKILQIPGTNARLYLLTPDLQRRLGVTLSEIEPGGGYGDETYSHRGEEFGLILEGRYEVTVGHEAYVLEAGDSIYFPSRIPHRTRALGDEPVKTLWVNTPPSF